MTIAFTPILDRAIRRNGDINTLEQRLTAPSPINDIAGIGDGQRAKHQSLDEDQH